MPQRNDGKGFAAGLASEEKGVSRSASVETGGKPIERDPRSKSGGDETSAPLAPGLYVVATPIGNLADITLRAVQVLQNVDLIACEDTRVTATLARRYGLRAERVAYHDHNAERMRPVLIERLRTGARLALVSDAGTPLISDPGFKLVRDAIAAGIAVTAVPGASAVLAALMTAGLPTDRFFFQGFLPAKPQARARLLAGLAEIPATLVFFESAPRLAQSLAEMAVALGDRPAAVARELTKLYEEVRRGSLGELAAHYGAAGPPKGEIVLVVGPPPERAAEISDESLAAALAQALESMSPSAASAALAASTGRPRREIYRLALEQKGGRRR